MAVINNIKNKIQNINTTLCKPSLVYIAVAIIAIISKLSTGILLGKLIILILYNVLWVILLNWLCQKGYNSFSWVLVIIPILVVPLVIYYTNKNKSSSTTSDAESDTETT